MGQDKQAIQYARETLELDPVEFGAAHELVLIYSGATAPSEREQAEQAREHFHRLMRGDVYNYLNLAADYADCGLWEEALTVLSYVEFEIAQPYPMVGYAQAYLYRHLGDVEQARECQKQGKAAPTDYCFPNTLFEFMVLQDALAVDSNDARAHYYLGNWLYDHKRYEEAIIHWETSREVNAAYSTVHRNLGLAYYNKLNRPYLALAALEEAFRLDSQDARIFYELDQLHKKIGYSCEHRIKLLEQHMELVHHRDDLYIEWVTLLNMQGSHQEAWNALQTRRFHPWEGGEGKVTGQYVTALTELAKRKLEKQQPELAMELLQKALVYPENLGEGKLEGAGDNSVYFYLGCAYQQLKNNQAVEANFHRASIGLTNWQVRCFIMTNRRNPSIIRVWPGRNLAM